MQPLDETLSGFNGYIERTFAPEDDALRAARDEMRRAGLPEINVSASEGQLLHVLALMNGAKRVLEIGTLGGYSAIWLARALPESGRLISLELDPHHAEVARRNLERAGVQGKVEVRVGPASESLQKMRDEGEEPFDMVFIDADKDGYVVYLEHALALTRSGGVIMGDNTLPDAVLSEDADSGTKRYNAAVVARPELTSALVPMLRERGVDGLLISIKQ
jgi:predicted O-methyltransferase YrrM